ncbi:hypothetical protein P4J24_14105 [Bacillus anthracis]|uniref:hypothetical protein n=1 Tax=Bacillus cereus group TaxID=86661 RepID=UPI00207BCC44|nr:MULTISPECIES: hypothetical protein [Bacillus cereus group]MEB9683028.1 hypothetical protein [Bacillus anthracis]
MIKLQKNENLNKKKKTKLVTTTSLISEFKKAGLEAENPMDLEQKEFGANIQSYLLKYHHGGLSIVLHLWTQRIVFVKINA